MAFDLGEYAGQPKVIDGAWGTQLAGRGLPAGSCPELWNSDNPQAVEDVAGGYVEAGSDIILTNTFGGNRFILASHGVQGRAGDLCRAGAEISKRIAGDSVKVFGSIGPSGKIVMMEEVGTAELEGAFAEAAEGLAAGGADGIVLETFNELAELEIALVAVKRACSLPVVACMTFSCGPEKTRTMMGNSPEDLVALVKRCGAEAVGANCGLGPAGYVRIAELLRAAAGPKLPVWIKPNAGMPEVGPGGQTVYPMGPEEFASYVPSLLDAGANLLGGCCGTTPEHIRKVRAAVDRC